MDIADGYLADDAISLIPSRGIDRSARLQSIDLPREACRLKP